MSGKELKEAIIEIIDRDCPENEISDCQECPYAGEAQCISHRKYDEIYELMEDNR